ncbi:acetoin utilization protein AcuC [Thiohalophilus sp.]|uniref:acetoin utilization protein AcuC n=1 Tax=Thiohalophilus sp. TaxID=3028392 RepID=UPI003975CA61
MSRNVIVYHGEQLARYHFGAGHPFGPKRHDAFVGRLRQSGLDRRVARGAPVTASREAIERFHTREYVDEVESASKTGRGMLDPDTPAVPGIYAAAATVVGTGLAALEQLMEENYQRAFVPIAGLHHAYRDRAAGFCVFNDCGVIIETLREVYGISRVAYVDIDAHHGDGVFYSFEYDPQLFIVDVHEDGRYLYPGSGASQETGKGEAMGTKLNIPLPVQADDEQFIDIWPEAENFLAQKKPEVILLQCGADSLRGDPITHLHYSEATHAHVTRRLCTLADRHSQGRLLALGGGGYNLDNLATAWSAVVEAMVNSSEV